MNLRIGKIKNYNNKILVSSPSFEIRTNSKINLDEDKPDIKPKGDGIVKTKPNTGSNKEHKHMVSSSRSKNSVLPQAVIPTNIAL